MDNHIFHFNVIKTDNGVKFECDGSLFDTLGAWYFEEGKISIFRNEELRRVISITKDSGIYEHPYFFTIYSCRLKVDSLDAGQFQIGDSIMAEVPSRYRMDRLFETRILL